MLMRLAMETPPVSGVWLGDVTASRLAYRASGCVIHRIGVQPAIFYRQDYSGWPWIMALHSFFWLAVLRISRAIT